MHSYTTLVLLVLPMRWLFAQGIISGTVKNDRHEPINGASVTISEAGETDHILAYDITNTTGTYRIPLKSPLKNIQINVRALGYQEAHKPIENKSQVLDFSLGEAVVKLREVIVKVPPIQRRGDTISYNVQSFADQKDRSIADVLAKMPGIEVLSDGRALYQGKALNKFYINGLDLLEGKYSLATQNLPYGKVSQVQVLENHQPIKILDSVVFSDRAALNIKLKNAVSFTGKAEAGTGFSPLLWNVNATPMLFTPKGQTICTYQTNNIGDDVGAQLKTLTVADLLENYEAADSKQDWLSIQRLQVPNLPKKRWLDNHVHLLTANGLIKLKKDYQLRANLSYLNDYQRREGHVSTVFLMPNDRVSILENKYNQLYFNSLESNLTLEKNTEGNYLKNSLQFQGFWDGQRGSMGRDEEALSQDLSNRYFELSNALNSIFPIGKQLIRLHSSIVLSQTPQELIVLPGPFQDLLSGGADCDSVSQSIDLKHFHTDNSMGFTKAWKRFTWNPQIGFRVESQHLGSEMVANSDAALGGDFSNDLDQLQTQTYFDTHVQYKKGDWRIELSTPISYHAFRLKDRPLQRTQRLNRLTWEPRLYAIYDLNAFWKLRSSFGLRNRLGAGRPIHYAYILRDYRRMERTDTPLSETFTRDFNAGISYRNPIRAMFAHLSYSHFRSENNLLYSYQIGADGTSEVHALARDNDSPSHHLSAGISKYFSALKTNVSARATLFTGRAQQMINAEGTAVKNQNAYIELKADMDLSDRLSLTYQTEWSFAKSEIQSRENQSIGDQTHSLSLDVYPTENQYIRLGTTYFQNDLPAGKTSHFFADLSYRYTLKKVELELQWNNIFNTENYKSLSVDDFGYVETDFRLRPRQILCKLSFSL